MIGFMINHESEYLIISITITLHLFFTVYSQFLRKSNIGMRIQVSQSVECSSRIWGFSLQHYISYLGWLMPVIPVLEN